MGTEYFDNVKDQVGFCGIWCGSCAVGNGVLKELTERYADVVDRYGLKEWASEGYDFSEFRKGLASIREVPVCSGCLKGGGRDNCEMKTCASDRKLKDCCGCNDFMTCENSEALRRMREGARAAGILVKDRDVDRKNFVKKGISELKTKSPHCLLFCEAL